MFTCDWCGETFTQKCHVNRHIISVHERTDFKCFHCDFVTNRKDNLARHIRSKHLAKHSTVANEIAIEPKNKKKKDR